MARLCADPRRVRRQRLWDGAPAGLTLVVALALADRIWPFETWPSWMFATVGMGVLAAGTWVAGVPGREGRLACLDDHGITVQRNFSIRRLAWADVIAFTWSEYAMGAYRLEFEGPVEILRVDVPVFEDEQKLYAFVREHLPWSHAAWMANARVTKPAA